MPVRSPKPPGRGRPRRASASTDILDAALETLAERGFQAATIESIAARAGVGRNTIYRRWSSKEELIADALQKLVVDIDLRDGDDIHALLLDWIRDFVRVFGDPLYGRILPAVLGEVTHSSMSRSSVMCRSFMRPHASMTAPAACAGGGSRGTDARAPSLR